MGDEKYLCLLDRINEGVQQAPKPILYRIIEDLWGLKPPSISPERMILKHSAFGEAATPCVAGYYVSFL